MPQPVVAQIGSRGGIVGTIGLHAVRNVVLADRRRGNRNNSTTIIVVLIVIVARCVVARGVSGPAIIAIALRGDGAADHGTGNRAGNETAATIVIVVVAIAAAVAPIVVVAIATAVAAAITAAIKLCNAASAARTEAAANPRRRSCDTGASAGGTGSGAVGILGEACGRGHHRQNQGHCGSGTQNLKADHRRLHLRDTFQPLDGADVPEPRPFCALTACQTGAVRERNGLRLLRDIAAQLRHAVSSGRPAGLPRRYWTIRTADGIRACSASPAGHAL